MIICYLAIPVLYIFENNIFQEEFYGCKIQLADRETVEQNSGG